MKGIGIFLLTERNDYQKLQEYDALATARRLGVGLQVEFADNEVETQLAQIDAFVRSHVPGSAAIVEAVNDIVLEPLARRAVRAGIGWYLLNRTVPYMERLRRESPNHPLCAVSADQREIGRIQGMQASALLRGPRRMLCVQGPAASSSANDRLAGMKEILDRTEIAYQLASGDWTEESGERAVTGWLQAAGPNVNVDLVVCQSDAMAAGAIRALTKVAARLNLPELALVPVIGADGNPHFGMPLVDQKRLTATVIMPPVAGPAVELVYDTWSSSSLPPPVLQLPVRSYPEIATLTRRAQR
jgi:ABC-type sugar transport system substrate-binding protein